MTGAARASESTAVTRPAQNTPPTAPGDETKEPKSLDRYAEFGRLPIHARSELYRAREIREVADMVMLTDWGAKLTPVGAAAVAKWCIRRDVDPLTELDNVGGVYINAEYFLRKLGELRVRGVVRDVEQINIAADARLEKLANDQNAPAEEREWAKAQHYKRLRLRAQYNVPEEATGACLTLLHLAGGGDPIPGVKWGGAGTSVRQPKHGGGSAPNPVVEANPALSVESQSVRRAMRQLALKMPSVLPEMIAGDSETPEIHNAEPPLLANGAPAFPARGNAVAQSDGYDAVPAPAADEEGRPMPRSTTIESTSGEPSSAGDEQLLLEDRKLLGSESE